MHFSDKLITQGEKFDPNRTYKIGRSVLDIDGTTLFDGEVGTPTDTFLDVVRQVTARGGQVGFQTARGYDKVVQVFEAVANVASDIELVRWHGLGNGAQIVDFKNRTIYENYTVPSNIAATICKKLQEIGMRHWVNDAYDGLYNADFVFDASLQIYVPSSKGAGNNVKARDYTPNEALVIVADNVPEIYRDEVLQLGNLHTDITSLVYQTKIDESGNSTSKIFILHKNANKQHAFEVIAKLSGVPLGQTMVMGDGANDDVMLRAARKAGGVSMAVANAAEHTKLEATHLVPDQAKDGAAVGLWYVNEFFR